MITLYKSKRAVPKDQKLIVDVDKAFNSLYVSGQLRFNDSDFKIMQKIDKVSAYSNGYIKTRFADKAPVSCLSTGCKTCILANHLRKDTTLSIEQCGANALTEIFKIDNTRYLLSFCSLPDERKLPYEVRVNSGDEIYNDTYTLRKVWG